MKLGVGRITRAVAVGALVGGMLLGPLGLRGAGSSEAQFKGTGTGYALRVMVDLRPLIQAVPALGPVLSTVWGAIPGANASTPGLIDQYFIKTTSEADNVLNKARSAVAEGLINLDVVEADKVGQKVEKSVQDIALPSAALPLVKGQIGNLLASVGAGPDVDGSGVLNKLSVQLPLDKLNGILDDVLGGAVTDIVGQLDDVLTGVLGGSSGTALVDGVTSSITDLVGAGAPTSVLGGLAGSLGLPVGDLSNPTAVSSALTGSGGLLDLDTLLAQITGVLNNTLKIGDLASLTALTNATNTIHTVTSGVAGADSVSSLASLKVLGGLVDVGLFNLSSHSEAAGKPGTAKNTSSCSLADVKIGGGALGLSLDGKDIFLNGTKVPVVGDLVGTVKGLADQVLSIIGANVGLCQVADKVAAADGTAASQSVSALRVDLAPLGLFHILIDPTVQTAVAAKTVVAPAPAPEVNLPRTGAPIAATLIGGISIAGSALFLRRRFTH